jgi:hypothetical protein
MIEPNKAESFERFRKNMINCKEQRRKIILLSEPPVKPQVQGPQLCKAVTNDGKPCKFKAVPQFKCFCTRHGKD